MTLGEFLKSLPPATQVALDYEGRMYQTEAWDFDPGFSKDLEIATMEPVLLIRFKTKEG